MSIGLEVNRPPSPEPSRLDDWFLGARRGSQPRSTPVPFFPEVHEELTKSWMAPFTARSRSSASSVLTTLDGGVARGYAGIPQGGESGRGALVPTKRRHLEEPSASWAYPGRSQGLGAPAPQPVGASGQLGKEQALPCAENLFSRCGVRLGEYDGMPYGGTCPSSAELPEFLQRQECGTTETVSEAPGAYGIRSCSHAARIASYETTSALATLPGPEVGMAPQYAASSYLPAVSPLPQPLDRPCLSTGRGAPRTSVPAYCCHNRCLQHGALHATYYMQWAGSLGALDRAPTALAHQLPGAVGSAFSLATVPATAVGQARASPHGQHCGSLGGVYDHTACHSSPTISSSGVTRSSSHCVLFTSRGSSIVRPTRSHDSSRSPVSGDSIPRRSG